MIELVAYLLGGAAIAALLMAAALNLLLPRSVDDLDELDEADAVPPGGWLRPTGGT